MDKKRYTISPALITSAFAVIVWGSFAAADQMSVARERYIVSEVEASYTERGADIHPSMLNRYLPPPPRDALPYEVREPLRNGKTVPVKKRWLWVPEDYRITYEALLRDGKPVDAIEVPEGTMWWKEFYLETSSGTQLLERRIVRKEAGVGMWRLYTGHFLPDAADGVNGTLDDIASFLWTPQSSLYFYQPHEWLPTVTKSAPTKVTFYDNTGAEYPYIFPGATACTRCHNGAAGAYDEANGERTIVFGLHPRNLTARSLRNFIEQGLFESASFMPLLEEMEASEQTDFDARALLRPANGLHADPAQVMEARTRHLLAVLRNNCVSCHNHSPIADARVAAFKLDPNRDYSTRELFEVLSQISTRGPSSSGLPLVTPGRPDESEIYLRLLGSGGRARMPLAEGGLPEQDPYFLDLIEDWIIHLDESGLVAPVGGSEP